jgi:hypothetical protein
MRVHNRGRANPAYKGKAAKYGAIHAWVRRRKPKPLVCEDCKSQPPRDLANISGLYKRALSDYEYLCRACHMAKDGRSAKLRESGQKRKGIPMSYWATQEWRSVQDERLFNL